MRIESIAGDSGWLYSYDHCSWWVTYDIGIGPIQLLSTQNPITLQEANVKFEQAKDIIFLTIEMQGKVLLDLEDNQSGDWWKSQ